ncbi:hypothetical protein NPIL_565731 [Nephila pilipes]|uniref:Uncharacterized protein n=1 Tax=Nephila pilipes TaxID=299642 RepID=A0A8X6U3Y9_NEPPI|nr:hypothetical protein NPIL_565731 [Nephila pilipes]
MKPLNVYALKIGQKVGSKIDQITLVTMVTHNKGQQVKKLKYSLFKYISLRKGEQDEREKRSGILRGKKLSREHAFAVCVLRRGFSWKLYERCTDEMETLLPPSPSNKEASLLWITFVEGRSKG